MCEHIVRPPDMTRVLCGASVEKLSYAGVTLLSGTLTSDMTAVGLRMQSMGAEQLWEIRGIQSAGKLASVTS